MACVGWRAWGSKACEGSSSSSCEAAITSSPCEVGLGEESSGKGSEPSDRSIAMCRVPSPLVIGVWGAVCEDNRAAERLQVATGGEDGDSSSEAGYSASQQPDELHAWTSVKAGLFTRPHSRRRALEQKRAATLAANKPLGGICCTLPRLALGSTYLSYRTTSLKPTVTWHL